MRRLFFDPGIHSLYTSAALALVRLVAGGMMLAAHGWGKVVSFSETAASFPDPLGFGPTTSMGLVIFAEFFCSALVVLGLMTRMAAVPLAFTMFIAVFLVHGGDGLAKQELPSLYLVVFLLLFVTGAGRFSFDALIAQREAPAQS